jgi:uncharacterized Rmd1/YagE family protein
MIDNAIYTPYRYDDMASLGSLKKTDSGAATGLLVDIDDDPLATPKPSRKGRSKFLVPRDDLADIFVFGYGVVVIWGMTENQEKRFLSSL